MAVDIASALGMGTGINTKELVASLVSAARAPKQNAISDRVSTNEARISALASAKSSLSTFSTALTDLLKSSAYSGQAASSDATIATVATIPGGTPKGLPAQIEILQMASAQVLQSAALADSTATAGTGTLTITTGSTSVDVTLASPANTLADLASAINGANAGVTATVVSDKNGARIVLKGATGADRAFTVTAGADADADLARFAFDGTSGPMTRSQTAQDALIRIDNVDMQFASNTVTGAIPNLRIDLNRAAPGTIVTLATTQPTTTMRDLVQEFVSAYNELKKALNSATATGTNGVGGGALSSDPGVRDMSRRLAALTSTPLAASGAFRTLSDIGVTTNRDGTLTLNTTVLDKAIAADPAAVTAMLNPTVPDTNNPGIAGALKSVTDYLNGTDGPLAASAASYDKLKASLKKQLEALDTSMGTYEAQLTKTYSAMQARLTQLQGVRSYMEQQIKVWSQDNN